ncbi:flavodoxin family protein [Methanolobus sp. ZRKC2]|uniref:flavodoxin family protein n=1 Tax=Methanolobus sp. ZRKC2 TaxID=3125783 RepID=UPI0032443934
MKVVAFNGSPRKDGNTSMLVNYVFEELAKEGIETELVNITGEKLRGCTACMKCFERKDKKCIFDDDSVNKWIAKMEEADGIILASPTYFTDVTAEMKALLDRAGFVSKANDDMFARKTGAAVVAVRRAGSIHVYDTLNHFFGINEMIVPGSSYWNVGVGLAKGDVAGDEEGIQTMRNLGSNMAWLMKKIYG